ncbi:C-X-C chemokine receptor type 3-2-like [Latimeria chalumnae]|nr:PREDICTED: C-X-C chemokine receptor type 3-like [Latimeria chalumnae]|eukprot:XP_005999190.1 PREDICTED: C-X-C chemokine receptor type 3-like [Latimeria chalumnae]
MADTEYLNNTTEDFSTFDPFDYDYISDLEKAQPCKSEPVGKFDASFIPVVYSLVFVLGCIGNILVLVVLYRCKRMLAHTDTYLMQLAWADLLLVLTLPLWAVQAKQGWIFGNFLCKITGAFFVINLYSSILFLACVSFDRYLSIVHAVQVYKKQKPCYTYVICSIIWMFCIAMSVVELFFREVDQQSNAEVCHYAFHPHSANTWRVTLRLINLTLGFFLPLTVMIYCYFRIFRSLCHVHLFERQKSLKVIVAVIVVFILCWAPYNACLLVDTFQRMKVIGRDCVMENALDIAKSVTESLGLVHCCLNPILYVFVGVKFRKELEKLFRNKGQKQCRTVPCNRRKSRKGVLSSMSDSETTTSYSVVV